LRNRHDERGAGLGAVGLRVLLTLVGRFR
jgi:hypothetical protein